MPRIHLDFETRSGANLKATGTYAYVEDEGFAALLLSHTDPTTGEVADIEGHAACRDRMGDLVATGATLVAHNTSFDRIVASTLLGLPVGTYLDPEQWDDTMPRAAEYGLPTKLEALAQSLKTPLKDSAGEALIRFFCTPITTGLHKGEFRRPEDHPEKWADFVRYCHQDVEALVAIDEKLPAWPTQLERDTWVTDQRINDRGVKIDLDLAHAARATDRENKTQAIARMAEITGLANPNSRVQLLGWLNDQIVDDEALMDSVTWLVGEAGEEPTPPLPNLKAETVAALLDSGILPPVLTEVVQLRQDSSLTASAKYAAAVNRVSRDGRIRGTSQFFGSHTGRWAGRGLQLANLPRAGFSDGLKEPKRPAFDSDEAFAAAERAYHGVIRARRDAALTDVKLGLGASPHDLKALIRPLLIGPFAQADFNAVEGRVTAWFAGEDWALEVFRTGAPFYEATAAQMGEALGQEFTRQQGKTASLALGFAGGVGALRNMGAQGTDEELEELKQAWRAANPSIVEWWDQCWQAFMSGGRVGPLVFSVSSTRTTRRVKLPSGRHLYYRRMRKRTARDSEGRTLCWPDGRSKTEWVHSTWAGGRWKDEKIAVNVLINNIVQGTARDLLATSLVELERRGLDPVASIHDEILVDNGSEATADLLGRVMENQPAWATGLPLLAVGSVMDRFSK